MDDNRKKLYDALSGEYDMGTYDQFCKDIQDSGKRKRLYDATSKEYDYGTYDSFSRQLGFDEPTTASHSQKPAQKPQTPVQKPRKTVGTRMTEAERQNMLNGISGMVAQSKAGLQRTKNRMNYAKANTGLRVPGVKLGVKGGGVHLGQNSKVVETKPQYNAESGKVERSYLTESGNEYNERGGADLEQNAIDEARFQSEQQEAYLLREKQRIEQEMNQRGRELDAEAVDFSWRDMPRGSGGAIHTYNSSTVNGRFADTKYKSLLAQLNKVNDGLATLAEAKKGKASDQWIDDSSNWASKKGKQLLAFGAGAWRGLAHAVGKVSTWDMGMTDMATNGALYTAAVDADRKGIDNISREDRDLLDITAYTNAIQSENEQYLGRGYKAGQVTGESLPFMIEMMLNPASKLGTTATNKLMREAVKRYGKDAVKKATKKYLAAKIGTRLMGDAVGSMAMAGTTGQGHVTADMLNRLTGDVQFKVDDSGKIVYGGREGAEDSVLKAYMKAFGAQTIENHSEMVGEYFAPFLGKAASLTRKGMDKIGLGKVNKLIDDIGATNAAKMLGDFEKQTKWNGTFGEYAEEVVGNIENAILVGDNTLDTAKGTGVFNADQNIDTFLGVSLMGGFFAGAKTLSYRGPKRQALNEMSDAGKVIDNAIGDNVPIMEKWGGWRNTFLVGTDEEKKAALREVMDNTDLPIKFRMGVLNFVKAAQKYEGIVRAQESKVKDGEQDPVAQSSDESYDNGYDTTEPEAMNDAKNMYDYKRQQMSAMVTDEFLADFDNDPVGTLSQVMGRDDFSEDEKQLALDYVNAKATYDGMIDRVRDDIDSRIEESNATVNSRTNRNDGMIHPATLKLDDRKVYIVDGTINMQDDGSMVDVSNSSESILVRDAETGKLEFMSPSDVLSTDESIDPATEKEAAQQALREQYAQEQSDNIDGVLAFNVGDTYDLADGFGQQCSAQIVADNGDGTVQVAWNGDPNNISTARKDELQSMRDIHNRARINDYEQQRAAQRQEQQAEAAEPQRRTYNLNDEITLRDEEGNPVRGSITAEENEDGEIEVYTEHPINGKQVQLLRRDELDNMLLEQNGEVVEPSSEEDVKPSEASLSPSTPLDEDAASVGNTSSEEGGATLEPANATSEEQHIEEEQHAEPMPMIGEGEDAEPDFASVTPQRAHEYIFNESGLDEEDARDFMTNNLRAAETAVTKIKNNKPKMGTSIAKFNKNKAEWQQKLDEANANLDYWQQVKAERNAVLAERAKAQQEADKKQTEEAQAAEAAYREEMAKKEAEQAALGTNTVSPAIRDKWNATPKVEGAQNEIVLANGEKVAGRYYLVESGAATPSHNSANGFAKSEGFPVDENGGSVNDRDYERDKDAQQITRDIANKYDSRAMQTPVVVSQDGVVLSGNGRTMAGELAAAQGTDAEYNEHLAKYPTQYGFTSEQVKGMQHPRVVFVPDAAMPYTADTFAKFNQQEMKGQSKTEHSVKLGKVVDDETFNRIISLINRFDTLGDFYADFAASREAIGELFKCGAISRPQMAEMVDGDGLSAIGKETLENMLIGKAFESNPDAVREATEFKQMRQTIIQALAEISNNISLGKDYSLESELAEAIDLVYNARKSGFKAGDRVSSYARQQQFDFYGVPSTVADYKNATMLMIADILNDNRSTLLKKYLQLYNTNAKDAANGQLDIFSGTVASKESILNDINELLNYGTEEEQKKAAQEAVEKRKAESVAEAGVVDDGSEGSNEDNDRVEETPAEQAPTEEEGSKPVMSHDEKMAFMRQFLEDTAGDMRLLDVVTDEEVQKLIDLYDAWEVVNDGLGAAHDANDSLLNDKNKAIAQKAKENIETAENAANAAFAPVEDYYNELLNTHNIEDEEGDADEIETPSAETPLSDAISAAEAETDQNPTGGQKEAGNYKKGHVQVGTFDITIENPKGSVRRGKDANGKEWESKMNNTYGYFRGTEGVDGDHIDVFISNDIDGWDGRKVFVVDQYNPDGSFDEHKVMLGFNDAYDAKSDYLANYEKGWENGRRIDVSAVNLEDFEKWIASSKRKTKPFGEYKNVKSESADSPKTGAFGTIYTQFKGKPQEAIAFLLEKKEGEAVGALHHKDIGDIDLVWGKEGTAKSDGFGLAKLAKYHPEVLGNLQEILDAMVVVKRTDNRVQLESETHQASVRLTWDSEKKNWLLTAFEKKNSVSDNTTDTVGTAEGGKRNDTATPQNTVSDGKDTEKDSSDQENGVKSFKITPKEYTTKRGKKLSMHLVTFESELSKEQMNAAKKLAKDAKGWWSKEDGGFLMRDMESAQKLADSVLDDADAVADAQPVSLIDMQEATGAEVKKPKDSGNKLVTDERYAELKARMRKKLGQLNSGIDPERFAIGTEMALYHIERGARKFTEYAKAMIEDLGDAIRPYLKAFYNGARDLPEVEANGWSEDLTPYDEVRTIDIANFDKPSVDAMATAEMVVKEQEAEQQKDETIKKIADERNANRTIDEKSFRPATEEDIEKRGVVYYDGKPTHIAMVMHSGEQIGAAQFSKPHIDRIYLTNGKECKLEDLMVEDEVATKKNKPAKKAEKKAKAKKTQEPSLFGEIADTNENQNTESNEETNVQARSSKEGGDGQQRQQDAQMGGSAGNEAERTDGRGMGGRDSRNTESDGTGSEGLSRPSESKQGVTSAEKKNVNNNHAERGKDYAPKGVDARIDANIKAIELMQKLMQEGKQATPAQMKVLRQFSGWGGLGKAFVEKDDWRDNPTAKRLKELLGDEAYAQAEMSRNSAYYTPASVIDTMWDIARTLGFKGGKVLEGSAGIGNIIGAMPTDMSERSNIQAVEIDETTGNILSLLYPDAKVDVQGFEATRVPNGSVDLAITNVPFVTGLHVNDETGDNDLSKKFRDIHDFCIAKNVRKLREGGIGIFITSNGTLDSSQKLRNWLVNEGNADVIGAFRLNNQTFGGTGATSDIIVIRKRVNGKKSANAIDVSTVSAERAATFEDPKTHKERTVSMDYNKYFIEHPECMAGEMRFGFENKDFYRPTSKALYPVKGKNQNEMLAAWMKTFEGMKEDAVSETTPASSESVYEDLGDDVKEGSLVLDKDDKLCIAQYGKAVPLAVNANKVKGTTKAECFRRYQAIKGALADVLSYQTENESDNGLQPLLDKLNDAFDNFVKTYGHLHKNTSISFLKNDVDFPTILALEKYSEVGDKNGKKVEKYDKTDIFSQRVVEKEKAPDPKNVKDGIIASIYQYGRIDVPYIADKLGKSEEDVKKEIVEKGLGYENPATMQMEVSYEYLSGNVREKLKQAEEANSDGKYSANVEALRKVIPMDIPSHLIEFTLGSSWVDPKLYTDYIKERTDVDVQLTNVGGTWFMKTPYYTSYEKNKAMGVRGQVVQKLILGTDLIEAALQNKTITVSETHTVGYGSSKTTETITDKEATQACSAKIDEIRADFKEWARQKMQNDADMSERIERTYNEQFNNYVPLTISDEFVPEYFGGANHKFKMRPHQAKAIIRGTMQPLLLAHEVGTGKTFTLISTAMEMRRLGTAKKPMIVVQNATVGQFVASAKELYPNAKVLTLEDKDRDKEGRKNFYAKIKYNDWDMIVVPQSVFERIPDSEERQMRFIQDKIDEKMMVLEQMREADSDNDRNPIIRQAEKEIEKCKDEMGALAEALAGKRKQRDGKKEAVAKQNASVKAKEMLDRQTDDVEDFDDMGIDALLVDEAHEYKHLGFATAMQRGVKGIDPSFSKKSQGVYLKTQAVLEKNNGRNVIFATGTPISNTAAEIWTFMRYLMPADTMKAYDIYYFDDFVRNFGNLTQMLEFKTNGKFEEVNRFAGYVNLPELVRIWSSVADTVRTDEAQAVKDKVPDIEGGQAQDIYLPQTRALRSIMKFVKEQLNEYDKMSGKEKKENSAIPVTMYGIAQAAAVDPRLVMADAEDDKNSKTNEAVRQTLRSLKETAKYNGTIALFADKYNNKHSGFNLYEEIRKKLIEQGVPAEQVVIIRSEMSIKKKQEIFDKVNRGEIRVIMGSTFTLGTGVNIQERLHTLVHLDAPNRPMDYTQRNGRILRQGNLHKVMGIPIRILRFGVQDSLDVTAYQRLKTKGAIADSVMNGKRMLQNSMEDRSMEEDEDVFGDTVAQLSGSQYAMLKNQAEREVRKYESKKKQWEADQTYVHNAIPRINREIERAEERAATAQQQLDAIAAAFGENATPAIKVGKKTYADINAMSDLFADLNKKVNETAEDMRKSSGEDMRTRKVDVQIGDVTFTITTTQKKELVNHNGAVDTKISRSITYSCPELGLENEKGGAWFKNAIEDIFENVVSGDSFREELTRNTNLAERMKGELEQVKSREGQPFQYDKELSEAYDHLEEYTELMKKELEEKEQKYAEMDSEVEAATGVTEADEADEEDSDMYRLVDEELEDVNETFNEELQQQIEGNLPSNHIYRMGEPGQILLSTGVPDLPIQMNASRLKAKATSYGHDFELSEIKDLVKALQTPLAVFAYGDKTKAQNIIVPLQKDGKNFIVGLSLNPTVGERSLEINSIRNVFPKNNSEWLNWISQGKALYLDKEKVQTLIDQQRTILADVEYLDLNSVAKIVESFENPKFSAENILREGIGSYSDEELSFENDPVSKLLGKSRWNKKQQREFALRERGRMASRVEELAGLLHLNNVDVVMDGSVLDGDRKRAKGFYNKRTGRITIVVSNHSSMSDIEQTLLHEAVAHYGLRELFGEQLDTFLDNVYQHAEPEIRSRITEMARLHGWDFRKATEEYLAGLAETTDFEGMLKGKGFYGWWSFVKRAFLDMLHKIGFVNYDGPQLSDNELRYILWRSYENLKEPGRYRSILGEAEDISKQMDLKVGNFAETDNSAASVADGDSYMYRDGRGVVGHVPDAVVNRMYEEQVKDTRNRTMLGAMAGLLNKDGRKRWKNKFAESYFDYTRSVKALQDAISEATGSKVEKNEDVWKSLNAKSSIDEREVDTMTRMLAAPLGNLISEMVKKSDGKYSLDDIEAYLNAKHGVEERNPYMLNQAVEKSLDMVRKDERLKALSEGYSSDEADAIAEQAVEDVRSETMESARRDYSGLTGLFDPAHEGKSIDELEDMARDYVSEIEDYFGKDVTDELWKRVNALNAYSLRKSYECGLLSKKQYDEVRSMYQYYVPLRGWHDGYAGDVYNYVTRGGDRSMIENALKKAYGRTSRAGNILGTMTAMANSAIVMGNKNKVAQTFMNLALNHDETGMFTISEAWYEKNASDDSYRLVTPKLSDDMSAEEVADAIATWEDEMQKKSAAGEAVVRSGKFAKDFQYNLEEWKEQQHCVRVLRNGKEYMVYINGNPRATQAINGLLNPDYSSGVADDFIRKYMRYKAKVQTSLSPKFMISNLQRDAATAIGGSYAKYGSAYAADVVKNLAGNIDDIFRLFHKDRMGTLDMNVAKDRWFKEFVEHGGMTGVSSIRKKDEYEAQYAKSVERAVNPKRSAPARGWESLMDNIEFVNRCVENLTRFSVYMASRKAGKSVKDSVFDAKECSVNFNMKGSGAWGNATLRKYIMYANPALQSLRMISTWYAANKPRTIALLSSGVALGFLNALILSALCGGGGGDDDDNAYYALTDYNRHNYFNVGIANRKFLHWRLPQEMVPLYALGQIVYDRMSGRINNEQALHQTLVQLNNLSPMAFVESELNYDMSANNTYAKTFVKAVTPDVLSDISDAYLWQEDFLGRRIGNRSEWNTYTPEWQRVDKRTPDFFVKGFEWLDKATGGTDHKRGGVSQVLNPSAVWYILEQQGGGLSQVAHEFYNAGLALMGGEGSEDLEAKDYPFVGKFMVDGGTDAARMRVKNEKFWMYRMEYEAKDAEIKSISRDPKLSFDEKAARISELADDKYLTMYSAVRGWKKLRKEKSLAETDGNKEEEQTAEDNMKMLVDRTVRQIEKPSTINWNDWDMDDIVDDVTVDDILDKIPEE